MQHLCPPEGPIEPQMGALMLQREGSSRGMGIRYSEKAYSCATTWIALNHLS